MRAGPRAAQCSFCRAGRPLSAAALRDPGAPSPEPEAPPAAPLSPASRPAAGPSPAPLFSLPQRSAGRSLTAVLRALRTPRAGLASAMAPGPRRSSGCSGRDAPGRAAEAPSRRSRSPRLAAPLRAAPLPSAGFGLRWNAQNQPLCGAGSFLPGLSLSAEPTASRFFFFFSPSPPFFFPYCDLKCACKSCSVFCVRRKSPWQKPRLDPGTGVSLAKANRTSTSLFCPRC